MDWCLNPYVGCAHACVYCYASFMKRFTGHDEPWGTFVDAKMNVAKVLARQLRRVRSGRVMVATVTDAYQPAEAETCLTRECLAALADTGLSVSILTKSDLVVRDLDVLRSFGSLLGEQRVKVGFTITTVSDELSRFIEPGAQPTSRRLAAVEALAGAGIPTWVFVSPIIPGLTDSPADLRALVAEARRLGALEVDFDPLNFYPVAVHGLSRTIARQRPGVTEAFRRAVGRSEEWRERILAMTSTL